VEALLSLCNDKTQSGKPLLHPTNFFSFPKTTPRRRTAATSENTGAAPVSDDEEETSTANTVMTYINHRKRENNIPQNFVLDLKFKLPQGRPLAPAPLFPSALPDPNQTSLKSHNS